MKRTYDTPRHNTAYHAQPFTEEELARPPERATPEQRAARVATRLDGLLKSVPGVRAVVVR